ncbi:fungal-specific transcription factor domain-containing protein [Hypoxylon argillaceum]|nr:fungal-specific transcription factor domain-containing protein [Hypoxylon argillaceum]
MECSGSSWLSSSSPRACTNCQKRKSRCLRANPGDPMCISCTKTRRPCVFQSPPDRTPLTRRNLDTAELQVAQLRTLLKSLQPDLDIDAAIRRLRTCGGAEGLSVQLGSPPAEADRLMQQNYEWHEGSLSSNTGRADSSAASNDGMANLLIDENSGYLGGSSGSQLLEEISSAISSDSRPRRTSEELQRPRSSRPTEPSSDLPVELSATESRLVDTYFLYYNTCYPILHEKSFRDRLADQRTRYSNSPWHIIFYMVLAIGDWISSSESSHARSSYYNAARSCLSFKELESGTTETVQAFLLLGNYLQKRDRPNTGYNFVGLAWRLALGLGLHREVPNAVDTVENERRRSLFWVMYCFDNGFNITTGRPPTLSDGFIDTQLPRNIDYKDLSLASAVPPEVNVPTTYSAIAAQAQLVQIADSIYQEFLLAKTASTKVDYRVAELMERRLSDWQRNLPAYFTSEDVPSWFRAPRAIMLWKEQNLRILLWRGSREFHNFLPNKQSAETKCLEVAMQSIHDIATFCAAYETALHRGVTWYAIYFLFQAALVLEASYLQSLKQKRYEADSAFREHSLSQMRACMSTLAETNSSAKRCMEVLDSIHSRLCSQAAYASEIVGDCDIITDGPHNGRVDPYQSPSTGFVGGENEYVMFGSGLNFGDDGVDPTLRMLINPASSNMFEDMPLDVILDNWTT